MDILNAFLDLIASLGILIWTLVQGAAPWTPLVTWVAFWTLAVDWVQLRGFLLKGGWIGVVLLGLIAILVWGVVAPPEGGMHSLLGLDVSNFVGKTIYVTTLTVIMLLCGSTQLSGVCDGLLNLEQPARGAAGHGHEDQHGHDHHAGSADDHGGHGHALAAHPGGH